MTERRVPRIGRVLDIVAALLFLAGAALYARSWIGLRDMDAFLRVSGDTQFAAIARADELSRLGRIGVITMIAGVALGVVAAIVARRASARRVDEI